MTGSESGTDEKRCSALRTDGGSDSVGFVEDVETVGVDAAVLTVRTNGAGLDLYTGSLEIHGRLDLSRAASDRLVAHLYDGPDISKCVYCDETLLHERAHEHHYRYHTDRRYNPAWYLGDEDPDQDLTDDVTTEGDA